jgi:pimeloyl-ACP methyl ester carboxylesterase
MLILWGTGKSVAAEKIAADIKTDIREGMTSWIVKPRGYHPDSSYPLLVNLHGATGSHEVYFWDLKDSSNFNCWLISPESPGGKYWNNLNPDRYQLILDIVDSLSTHMGTVDSNRIYCAGFSGGGKGCWEFAVRFPDIFTAGFLATWWPIDGFETLKDFPMWWFLGEDDNGSLKLLVPAYDSMSRYEGKVRFSSKANMGHEVGWIYEFKMDDASITTRTLEGFPNNSENRPFNWLFSQGKKVVAIPDTTTSVKPRIFTQKQFSGYFEGQMVNFTGANYLKIINLYGKLIWSGKPGSGINTRQFQPGVYFVILTVAGMMNPITFKILITL